MIATLKFPGLRARAKPRPRTGKGFIYMSKPYQEWLDQVRVLAMVQLRAQGWQTVKSGPVRMMIQMRQKAWRGDSDQLSGAIMDALQGENAAYTDDCQVPSPMLLPRISNEDNIEVTLEVQASSKSLIEWVRQGEARQAGARKGRDMQAIRGRRKF